MKAINTTLILSVAIALAFTSSTDGRSCEDEIRANSKEERFVIMQDGMGNIHVSDLTQKVDGRVATISDVTIYLYTLNNTKDPLPIKPENFNGKIDKYFNPEHPIIFTIHGWLGSYDEKHMKQMTVNFLEQGDHNVFAIDWHIPAMEFYQFARESVPIVGNIAADFIDALRDAYPSSKDSKLTLIGFSLGGQMVGAIGSRTQPDVIVALDPAKPLFYADEPEDCLDKSDGKFVQVIHTSGGLLGFKCSLGHADYYPNGGGVNQPGCGSDLMGSCAHARSVELYDESIISGNFIAYECESYEKFNAGLCFDNERSSMGQYDINLSAMGDYYLNTSSTSPYALGDEANMVNFF